MNQRRSIGIIAAIVFLDLLGFGLVIPQLGVYAKYYDASGFAQGMLVASYSVMQFLFAPLLGRWSDRLGRKPVLIVSLATSLAGHVLFALAGSLPVLFASRLVDGLGGANISTAQAYLSDVTPPERRARAMGLIGAAFGTGFVFGPAFGALAGHWGATHWGPHGGSLAIGGLAALASLATLLLAILKLPESLPPEKRSVHPELPKLVDLSALRHAVERPALARLLAIFLVSTSGFAVLHAIMTYFVVDTLRVDVATETGHAAALTGYVFAWIGLWAVLVQGGGIGPLVARFGEVPLLTCGLFLLAVGLFIMPLAHSLAMLLLFATPLSIGNALCSANLPALLTFHSPANRRGEILGVSHALGSVGRIVGPLVGGALYDWGRPVPFRVGASLCAVAMLVSLGLPRERPDESEVDEAVAAEILAETV